MERVYKILLKVQTGEFGIWGDMTTLANVLEEQKRTGQFEVIGVRIAEWDDEEEKDADWHFSKAYDLVREENKLRREANKPF